MAKPILGTEIPEPDTRDPWQHWWDELPTDQREDAYGGTYDRRLYDDPRYYSDWQSGGADPWWTAGSQWETGQFDPAPEYPGQSQWAGQRWDTFNNKILKLQQRYSGFVNWYNTTGKDTGYNWNSYVNALSTWRTQMTLLQEERDRLAASQTNIDVPWPEDEQESYFNDLLGGVVDPEMPPGYRTDIDPAFPDVPPKEQLPGSKPDEPIDILPGGIVESGTEGFLQTKPDVPGEEGKPKKPFDIIDGGDEVDDGGGLPGTKPDEPIEPGEEEIPDEPGKEEELAGDTYDYFGLIDDWFSHWEDEPDKTIWDVLEENEIDTTTGLEQSLLASLQGIVDTMKGPFAGLSDEDKAQRRVDIQKSMKQAMSQAAFKGIAQGSKTFGKTAEIGTAGEVAIGRAELEAQQRAEQAAMGAGLTATNTMLEVQRAIDARDMSKAEVVLAAWEADRRDKVLRLDTFETLTTLDLNREQMVMARDWQRWQISMGERKFSEATRAQMVTEGFTADQIDQVERDMQQRWDMSEKNWGLAERAQSLNELKNAQGYGLEERMVALKEEMGLRSADLEDDKFRFYRETVEREFGVRLADQALRKFIETGRLEMDMLDMEWRNSIAERKEMHDFFLGTEGLALKEKLGMTELELKAVIQGEYISVQREAQMLEMLLTEMNIDFKRDQLRAQVQTSRDEADSRNDYQAYSMFIQYMAMFA